MERLGIGKNIKFIEIAGESCSRALYKYARRIFPNAIIVSFYGATEVENPPITYPCRPLGEEEPLELHHPREGYYLEIIDPQTQTLLPIEEGVEGEIVLSFDISQPAKPYVSPLVRYKTGDMARVIKTHCPTHGTWSFIMPGRVEMDFIKIPGGILRADEVARVLGSFGPSISDNFELHFEEREKDGSLKVAITLHVETFVKTDLNLLAREIEKRLRVGASFTYADGIERSIYLPIVCTPLVNKGFKGKRKRMVRD